MSRDTLTRSLTPVPPEISRNTKNIFGKNCRNI